MFRFKQLFGIFAKRDKHVTYSVDPRTLAAAKRVERGGHCSCLTSRTKKGKPRCPTLHGEMQDTSADGWEELLELISTRPGSSTILEPSAFIPAGQWSTIIILPASIETLTSLRELHLYGSHLRRLPPEIGRLTNLTSLDIYTSYSLHWLPYEVTRCTRLNETRMSTRALYGNIKTRLPFPKLSSPLEAVVPKTCSVCDAPFEKGKILPFWTTQRIGTDIVPLLIHSCSRECIDNVPDAPNGYYARPHKGGGGVGMPNVS